MFRWLLAFVLVVLVVASPAGAVAPGSNGRIVFFDNNNSNWFTMASDGSDIQAMTTDGGTTGSSLRISAGRVSPDGDRFVLGDGGNDIVTLGLDGSGRDVLVDASDTTDDWFLAKNPFWSPDGERIAFFSNINTGWELWSFDSETGLNPTKIFDISAGSSSFQGLTGDWSPTGDRIAFSFHQPSQFDTGVITVVTTGGSVVTTFPGVWPTISPDGTTILYSNPDSLMLETRPIGGGAVTELGVLGVFAVWSPDGDAIVYNDGDGDIWTANADGSGAVEILDNASVNTWVDWAPSGGNGSGGGGTGDGTFSDDDGNVFEEDIEWLASSGITRGCNPPANDLFCPDDPVTRGQMAAFLVRALGLSDAAGAGFSDTGGSTFAADIDRLANAGITRGCNPPANDLFCPDDPVTRGQMAAFLVRALGLSDAAGAGFSDTGGSTFAADIDRLANAGITRGCNPPANDLFCPNDRVTRGQMAAFLRRALG